MFRFAHFLSYCGFGFHGKSIGSYLVDDYYKRPVIISEYPEQLKPFYAHLMEDETKVSAFDIVMPKVSKKVLRTKGKKKRTVQFISCLKVFTSSDNYCSAFFSGCTTGDQAHSEDP